MFKSMGFAVALVLLSGCASWLEDRPAPASAGITSPAPSHRALDAEMRSRLALMRRQPDLASEELIRDLELFLRERERARLAQLPGSAGRVVVAPAVAPAAAPVEAAAVQPALVATRPAATGSLAEAQQLFTRARRLEDERQVARAVPLYADASRQGLMAASVRLMELYASGAEGVARNYLAAVRFKDLALQQGAKLEYHNKR